LTAKTFADATLIVGFFSKENQKAGSKIPEETGNLAVNLW